MTHERNGIEVARMFVGSHLLNMPFRIQLIEEDNTPMTGRRLEIAQSINDFLNYIGFPRIGSRENEPRRIPKSRWVPWGCRECHAENSGEVEYCSTCGRDRPEKESL